MKKKQLAKPIGRPSSYSEYIANAICERISLGESLRAICRDDNFPDKMTVLRWLKQQPEFRAQYTQARDEQADTYFEMILDEAFSAHDAQIGRLRVDALKWVSSRLAPKKYGDRIEHEHTGEQKLTLTFNTPSRDEHPELVDAEVIDGEYALIKEDNDEAKAGQE
jgi:hypothetical protein